MIEQVIVIIQSGETDFRETVKKVDGGTLVVDDKTIALDDIAGIDIQSVKGSPPASSTKTRS